MNATPAIVGLLCLIPTAARGETPPPAAPPTVLAVGQAGTFKPGALVQTWYSVTDAATTTNTFRIRRAELSARGDLIVDRFAYGAMFDLAKLLEFQDARLAVTPGDGTTTITAKQPNGASSILQDAYITLKTSLADVSMGQFKIPVSWEGFNPSSRLLFLERSLVAIRFGDKRDVGVKATKQFTHVGYALGLYNGTGQNVRDADTSKDGVLRLEAYPVEGLLVAGVVYATLWNRDLPGAKDRYEGDLRYEHGPLLLQGEYIYGKDVNKDGSRTRGHGFYTAAAGRIVPDVQLAFRLGYVNPDKAKLDDHTWSYEGILNYYVRGQEARLALAYSHFRNAGPLRPDEDTVVLAAQACF
jgi:hypothetical protein